MIRTATAGRAGLDVDVENTFESLRPGHRVTRDRITRSRLAGGGPPEVILSPRLAHIGLLEFHRAGEAIKVGQTALDKASPEIQRPIDA